MDNATDIIPVDLPPETPADVTIFEVVTPQFTESMFSSTSTTTPNIDTVLENYFSIFPVSYLLLLIGFGISAILLYTLYNYLDY